MSLYLYALLPVCLPAGTQAYRQKRKQAYKITGRQVHGHISKCINVQVCKMAYMPKQAHADQNELMSNK